jgi:hypothetical protein
MKLTVITLAKNERIIMPFFLRHYERFADEIIVFDNQSTDGTRDIIQCCPKTRLVDYNTGGLLYDSIHGQIKNDVYRNVGQYALKPPLKADWFVIVDADEMLVHSDIRAYLQWCLDTGVTMPRVKGYEMMGDTVPKDDGKSLITDLIVLGADYPEGGKQCIVPPSVQINYLPGAHVCHPSGKLVYTPTAEIKLCHYRYLTKVYAMDHYRLTATQMSEENKQNGYGTFVYNLAPMEARYDKLFSQRRKVIP